MPLALGKHRNRLGKAASGGGGGGGDGDAESTSSGESTPQKKKSPSSQTPASSLLIKPAGVPMPRPMTAAAVAATTVRRGAQVAKPGLGQRKKRLFFGGGGGGNSGGSSCSSAMSSLESIRSNASDGVQGGYILSAVELNHTQKYSYAPQMWSIILG